MMKKVREAYFLLPLPQRQKRSCFCKTNASKATFLRVKPLDHRDNQILTREKLKNKSHSRAILFITQIRPTYSERLNPNSKRAEWTTANYRAHARAMREHS